MARAMNFFMVVPLYSHASSLRLPQSDVSYNTYPMFPKYAFSAALVIAMVTNSLALARSGRERTS